MLSLFFQHPQMLLRRTLMNKRIYNFSAGPAVLPDSVLQKAQSELLSLNGIGMSVMEISHRSKHFDEDFRKAPESICANFFMFPTIIRFLFLQGGASLAIFDDSAEFSRQKRNRRLHHHRRLGQKSDQGSAKNAEMRKRSFQPKAKVSNQFRRRKN